MSMRGALRLAAAMSYAATDCPSLTGRTLVVTGGNGGIGLEAVRVFAEKGARVVIAARNMGKAEVARTSVLASFPAAAVEVRPLDVSSQASVREFAERWGAEPIHVLVNNAGVMAVPRALSVDGWETQFATNHLGHYALTMRLLPALRAAGSARVVTIASGMHWVGRLAMRNLDGERGYDPWVAYAQSKLCNLLFTRELDRRLMAAGLPIASLAAHPGYASTDLQYVGPRTSGSSTDMAVMKFINLTIAQSAAAGALPTIRAATDPEAKGGEYWGPRFMGWRGAPERALSSGASRNIEKAAALWAESAKRTGLDFPGSSVVDGGGRVE